MLFYHSLISSAGVIKIKLLHLLALCPTDQDVLEVYNNGAIFAGHEKARLRETDAKREHSLALTKAKLQLRIAPKAVHLVSEGSVLIGGHLRVLFESGHPHRNSKWRRYYFVVANMELMYWSNKSDVYSSPCAGSIRQIIDCQLVVPDTPHAQTLLQKGCSRAELNCAFVVIYSASTLTAKKTVLCFFVANSARKRQAWVLKVSNACQHLRSSLEQVSF